MPITQQNRRTPKIVWSIRAIIQSIIATRRAVSTARLCAMSDIAKTLVDILAAAKLRIWKTQRAGQVKINAQADPKGGGGGTYVVSRVVESEGEVDEPLRDVLLEIQQKVKDWPHGGNYPTE